jgi:HEPN domain-containing protein
MKTELIFLEMAKNDLEAARCLYSKKLYSLSIFHLQQAIEKAVKCFGIANKIISESEAKDTIGHEAWRLYLRIFNETKNKIVKLEETFNRFPKLKEVGLIKELNILNKMQNYEHVFKFSNEDAFNLSFSNKKLQIIANEIKKLSKSLKEMISPEIIDKEESNDFQKRMYELLEVISENIIIDEKSKEKLNEILTPQLIFSFLKMLKELIVKLIFCFVSLFYLSVIFSPHAVKSRYPQNEFNPLEVYTDKMPLIQMLDFFIEVTGNVLVDLNYILHSDFLKMIEK